MATVAGVAFPCVGCRKLYGMCDSKVEVQRAVFFSISNGRPVSCSEFEEERWHGLEGVRA